MIEWRREHSCAVLGHPHYQQGHVSSSPPEAPRSR
jgi:hypothetical protein